MTTHSGTYQTYAWLLSYLACFLLASAGDNASVLGNIGNSYWHYQVTSSALTVIMMTHTRQPRARRPR